MKPKSLAFTSLAVSIGSLILCISFICLCAPLRISSMGIVLTVLSMLVMFLVGWQIIQYIFAEKRITEISRTAILQEGEALRQEATRQQCQLLQHSNRLALTMMSLFDARFYTHAEHCALAVDAYFHSLNSMPQSLTWSGAGQLTDRILENIVSLLGQSGTSYENCILEGKRHHYLKTMERIHSDYKSQVVSLLQKATEVPDNGQLYATDEDIDDLFPPEDDNP